MGGGFPTVGATFSGSPKWGLSLWGSAGLGVPKKPKVDFDDPTRYNFNTWIREVICIHTILYVSLDTMSAQNDTGQFGYNLC